MDGNNILKDLKNLGRKRASEKDFLIAILLVGSIVIIFFVYVNFIPKPLFEKKFSIQIIEIKGDCKDCMDVGSFTEKLSKENNIKINSKKILDYNSKEAKSLIEKYSIKTVPALILFSKNIDEIEIIDDSFSRGNNYAIFDKSVPYLDLDSGEIKGQVYLKEIYTDCEDCMPLSQIQKQLENLGIKIRGYEAILDSSEKGKEIIERNNLTFLPTLLISKEIEEYWWVFPQIKNSFIEKEGDYIFKNPIPPYKDISTGKIKGLVDITYLTNKSCEDCFNVTVLKSSFQNLGVYIKNEKYIDVSDYAGKRLLKAYNITAIPTVILSKEIQDYESIKNIFGQVGDIEGDGTFIFRKLDRLNVKYQKIE